MCLYILRPASCEVHSVASFNADHLRAVKKPISPRRIMWYQYTGQFFSGLALILRVCMGTSVGVQWLRIHLTGDMVWSLVQEDPTCHGATEPECHSYWACALEPRSHDYWSPHTSNLCSATRKPQQWEALTLQGRVVLRECLCGATESEHNKKLIMIKIKVWWARYVERPERNHREEAIFQSP